MADEHHQSAERACAKCRTDVRKVPNGYTQSAKPTCTKWPLGVHLVATADESDRESFQSPLPSGGAGGGFEGQGVGLKLQMYEDGIVVGGETAVGLIASGSPIGIGEDAVAVDGEGGGDEDVVNAAGSLTAGLVGIEGAILRKAHSGMSIGVGEQS